MRTNYKRGRDKEYKIKKKLEELEYIVCRTAGSHSPFDLIAINKELKQIRFIQCKPKNFGKTAKEKLYKEYDWLNKEFSVIFEVE